MSMHRPLMPSRNATERAFEDSWHAFASDIESYEWECNFATALDLRSSQVVASCWQWLGTNVGLGVLRHAQQLHAHMGRDDAYLCAWAIHRAHHDVQSAVLATQWVHGVPIAKVTAADSRLCDRFFLWLGGSFDGQRLLAECEASLPKGVSWKATAVPPRREIELLVLLAMEATELSEGQASKALAVDRLFIRTMRDDAVSQGLALAERNHGNA